jgi:plasmid stabilization system protein ParE
MSYQIIYHNDAENDIRNAKKWYKNQQTGLDKKFALALKETINYIIENPLLFEVKYRNTRIAFTKVFPYGIHYHFDNNKNTITILSVLHTSRDSKIYLSKNL